MLWRLIVSDWVMSLVLENEGMLLDVVNGYAPQCRCKQEEKEKI